MRPHERPGRGRGGDEEDESVEKGGSGAGKHRVETVLLTHALRGGYY